MYQYGPEFDPVARVARIVRDANMMNALDFHYQLVDLFRSLRDGNTEYAIPGLHGCVAAIKPISFAIIEGEAEEPFKIVVSEKTNQDQILRLNSELLDRISIGDVLETVDNIPIQQYLSQLKFIAGGASNSGSLRAAVSYLSRVEGRTSRLPPQDQTFFGLRTINGTSYVAIIPWIAERDRSCALFYNALTGSTATKLQQAIEIKDHQHDPLLDFIPKPEPQSRLAPTPILVDNTDWFAGNAESLSGFEAESHDTFEDDFDWTTLQDYEFDPIQPKIMESMSQNNKNSSIIPKSVPDSPLVPLVQWGVFEPQAANIGVLTLDTFDSKYHNVKQIVRKIRNLLLTELSNTSALIIDVRSNKGGSIELMHQIPQFFGLDVKSSFGRVVNHTINSDILLDPKNKKINFIGRAYSQPPVTSVQLSLFSPLFRITNDIDNNLLGQIYVKPVGVFTSANCIAACEVFVAMMQDNKLATIFGEDEETGGVGSEARDYHYFNKQRPDHFPPLPFHSKSSEFSHKLKIAWMQNVRLDGSLIEEVGIKSDVVVRPTHEDLVSGQTWNSQFERIASALIKEGAENGKGGLYFRVIPDTRTVFRVGNPLSVDISTQGYHEVTIYDDQGKILESYHPEPSSINRTVFQLDVSPSFPRNTRIRFEGSDSDGKVIYRTWRKFKWIPKKSNYLRCVGGRGRLRMNPTSKFAGLYQDARMYHKGWKFVNGEFVIGDGKSYGTNIDSTKSFFLYSDLGITLKLRLKYDTEPNYDFIRIGYIKDQRVTYYQDKMRGFSGQNPEYQKIVFPAGYIEFFVRFISDDSISGVGAKIASMYPQNIKKKEEEYFE